MGILKTKNKNKNKGIHLDVEDNNIVCFYDGDEGKPLGEGEHITKQWSF